MLGGSCWIFHFRVVEGMLRYWGLFEIGISIVFVGSVCMQSMLNVDNVLLLQKRI